MWPAGSEIKTPGLTDWLLADWVLASAKHQPQHALKVMSLSWVWLEGTTVVVAGVERFSQFRDFLPRWASDEANWIIFADLHWFACIQQERNIRFYLSGGSGVWRKSALNDHHNCDYYPDVVLQESCHALLISPQTKTHETEPVEHRPSPARSTLKAWNTVWICRAKHNSKLWDFFYIANRLVVDWEKNNWKLYSSRFARPCYWVIYVTLAKPGVLYNISSL